MTLTDTISVTANFISVGTPVILLIWFCITSKRHLKEVYFKELPGKYAGFTNPVDETNDVRQGGFLMRILSIDANGYFLGEFDYGESRTTVFGNNQLQHDQIRDGIFECIGQITHRIYRSKARHPMHSKENRQYKGKFYVVDRLDFDFRNIDFETYNQLEYEFIHFREMNVIELNLVKTHRELNKLPEHITLYKDNGLTYSVYDTVKQISFRDFESRAQ
jgi:hypothetical protein